MIPKQDKTAARTPTDLERKYDWETSFSEIMGVATDARKTAESAKALADNASAKLTPEEVFNLLTENGTLQGIYRGDNGEIYINASYLMSGIIDAAVVKVKNLIAEKLKSVLDNSELNIDGAILKFLSSGNQTMMLTNQAEGLPIFYMTDYENGIEKDNSELSPHHLKLGGTSVSPTFAISARNGAAMLKINETGYMILSWRANGDGTYTLIGT